jgi:hypothetical protein
VLASALEGRDVPAALIGDRVAHALAVVAGYKALGGDHDA